MSIYRTHNCSELRLNNLNENVILSGWVDTIRDHGNLKFIDIRDNYGQTQCVIDAKQSIFKAINELTHESIIKINGEVIKRSEETVNKNIPTGEIEIKVINFEILFLFSLISLIVCVFPSKLS